MNRPILRGPNYCVKNIRVLPPSSEGDDPENREESDLNSIIGDIIKCIGLTVSQIADKDLELI